MKAAQAHGDDFSLVLGGPLYQLLLKTRLARSPLQLLHRRMLVIPAVAWLPLLILSLIEGHAISGVNVPFLMDLEAYARFLVAMPALILAELVVHQRLGTIVHQFRERSIVAPQALPKFEAAIDSAMRLRNSVTVEVALLVTIFVLGPWLWHNGLALQTGTWYAASAGDDGVNLTRAGGWFVYLSAPLFQFLLLRWYFRLLIWWRFLWRVSRLPLELKASHPDRAGGIGFLGESMSAFMPMLFAQGAVASGLIASRVLFGARSALEFRAEVAMLIVLLVAMVMIPLLFFGPGMIAARQTALRKYGTLATAYVRDFEQKWLSTRLPAGETLIGSPDIQSLADLAGSNDVVREMRTLPFDKRVLIRLVAATAAPFLPLVLTVIPFSELIQRAIKMIL